MKYALPLLLLMISPALAEETAALKEKVSVEGSTITLNDLLQTPVAKGDVALFAAPAPGATGTIAVARVIDAAKSYDVTAFANTGAQTVQIEREARKVSVDEIRQTIALKAAAQLHADAGDLEINFTRSLTALTVEKDNAAPLSLSSFRFEPVSGRFEAKLFVPGSATLNEATPAIITGALYETADALQIKRSISRGQIINAGDIETVRLKRQLVSANIARDSSAAIGMAARRNLNEDSLLRKEDIEKAQIIDRNEMVLIVYETPLMTVTTRGKALAQGGLGDVIEVMNLQSKKSLQATITGDGKVSVNGASPAKRFVTAKNE